MDNDNDRPERRTAIVARELSSRGIDIAALSETRLADDGIINEVGGGYTFFWKGKPKEEARHHGVGFAIKSTLLDQLQEYPLGINERLMTLRLKLSSERFATIVSAYAPTLQADEPTKDAFYHQLDTTINNTPREDKLIILGDFNARVGTDYTLWPEVLGKHGVGKMNDNGRLLLSLCTEHELTITNSLFRQRDRLKTTWMHPRSKHWHMLDYIITRARDRNDVRLTRAVRGSEDCWTDHRLVRATLIFNIARKRRNPRASKKTRKVNVEALKDPVVRSNFSQHLTRTFSCTPPSNDTNKLWESFKSSVLNSAAATLGYAGRKHQDWFDQNDKEIEELLRVKKRAFDAHQACKKNNTKRKAHAEAKAEVQRRTRTMKNEFWKTKANELEAYAANNDLYNFHKAARAVYGPKTQINAPLRPKEGGSLLRSKEEIASRWKEHFEELLNRPAAVDETIFENIEQRPVDLEMAAPPTLQELKSAINNLKNRKAAGPDAISPELLKNGGPTLLTKLHCLILRIWESPQSIPADWKNATICTLFKKGDKTDCGNYRGISLLSIAGKVLASILRRRLDRLAERILPESQCGFRPSRGTTDMIFSARQLQEKCREQNRHLYMTFFDLSKAFDTVNRTALWRVLKRYGCPDKLVSLIQNLHENMQASVRINNELSAPFNVTTGVKQGCVMAPSLFTIYLCAMLELLKDRGLPGIDITYRMDRGIFNIRAFDARTKTSRTIVLEFQYADDAMVCAESEEDMQLIVDIFSEAYARMGLSINVRKTKVLYQPAPYEDRPEPTIKIGDTALENVSDFPYLGSHLSSTASVDKEIEHRISRASASFGRLRQRIFDNRDLTRETKVRMYSAVVIPTLLYGAETWATTRRHIRTLEGFHQRCLRRILNVRWQDKRTNTSVIEAARSDFITVMIARQRTRWAGHVARMPDDRLPKQLLFSKLTHGTRHRGRPRMRFKDALKQDLQNMEIPPASWDIIAQSRPDWRRRIRMGSALYRDKLVEEHEAKRSRRRERQNATNFNNQDQLHTCTQCGKVCRSRIGLISHQRTHPTQRVS